MKEKDLTYIELIPSEGKAKRRLIFEQKNLNGYTTYYIFAAEDNDTHGDFYAISERELQEVEQKIYSGTRREFRSKDILPDIKAHIKEHLPHLETTYNLSTGQIRLCDVCFILYRQDKLDYRSGKNARILFARQPQRSQTLSNTPAQQSKTSSTTTLTERSRKERSQTSSATRAQQSKTSSTTTLTERSRKDMYKFLREVAKQVQSETKKEWISKGEVSKRLEKYLENHKFKKYDGKFRKLVADSGFFETKPDDSQLIRFKRK